MSAYEDAVATLYQAPFAEFVAERKRLAAELKASGDKVGAAGLAKLSRPPISAWTVNQLCGAKEPRSTGSWKRRRESRWVIARRAARTAKLSRVCARRPLTF
jgi:hypothetical protein